MSWTIAGLLPALAQDLDVGLAAAGHLVTAFSLAHAVGAPVIAVLTAELERRRVLVIAMSGFILANLLAALAPNYAGLLAARLLLALSAATFMPAAADMLPRSEGQSVVASLSRWSTMDLLWRSSPVCRWGY